MFIETMSLGTLNITMSLSSVTSVLVNGMSCVSSFQLKRIRINESLLLHEQDTSLPSNYKRKAMKLEPETYIASLYYNHTLTEGFMFVNNKVIEEPEHGLFFIDLFGDPSFQRVSDIEKVETETLMGYKMMALNVKSLENQRFIVLMNKGYEHP
ncbi:hypothetical protein Tco_0246978 [Tanacetum coccineum]